jgi:hypothetical protein
VPLVQQHVLGLQVAVHHAAAVRVPERVGHLAQHADRLADRELTQPREAGAEALPLDERHRVVEQPVALPRGEQRDDVRVPELRGERDLAPEPLGVDGRRRVRRQHLHDDPAAEGSFRGHEDARHPAAAELALEGVCAPQRRLQPRAQSCRSRLHALTSRVGRAKLRRPAAVG